MIILITITIIHLRGNDHHHPSTRKSASFVYDAIIIMMTIIIKCVWCDCHHMTMIIIRVRWDDHHDYNYHQPCMMRWSSWWRSSSSVYDAMIIMMTIIIIRVRYDVHHFDNHHHPCTMRCSSWWQSSSSVYDAMIIMMTIIIIRVRCDQNHDDDHHHTCTMRS